MINITKKIWKILENNRRENWFKLEIEKFEERFP
jgi:hypothetical protein